LREWTLSSLFGVRWRDSDGVRWLEAELSGGRAAFTTRVGGVSGDPFESLNLGLLTGDDPAAVRENRHRTAAALGLEPDRFLIGRQVHGAEVQARDAPPEPNGFAEPGSVEPAEVDGQATAAPGLVPLVFVADCLPVAVSGPGGVAMLHCGWRGLAGGIVERGASAVGATAAAIGPGIGRCCFEVGDEVLDAFSHLGDGIAVGRMLDLVEVTRRLLEQAGVTEVEAADLCTSCEGELFFSHRRDDGRTGRQAGLVWRDGDG
jgi:YfiH family protein